MTTQRSYHFDTGPEGIPARYRTLFSLSLAAFALMLWRIHTQSPFWFRGNAYFVQSVFRRRIPDTSGMQSDPCHVVCATADIALPGLAVSGWTKSQSSRLETPPLPFGRNLGLAAAGAPVFGSCPALVGRHSTKTGNVDLCCDVQVGSDAALTVFLQYSPGVLVRGAANSLLQTLAEWLRSGSNRSRCPFPSLPG